jgi:hypothetical protein
MDDCYPIQHQHRWIQAQSEVARDTLAPFRVHFNVDELKLNLEPAPPDTMLNGPLLEKLGGTVKKLLDDKGTAATDATSLQQLADAYTKNAGLEAKLAATSPKKKRRGEGQAHTRARVGTRQGKGEDPGARARAVVVR